MITIRSLLGAAVLTATLVSEVFASYTGPDSNVYTYQIINWFKKELNNPVSEWFVDGDIYEANYYSESNSEVGIVVLGPRGVEDFSASKQTSEISHSIAAYTPSDYSVIRRFTKYTPGGNTTWDYEYYGAAIPPYNSGPQYSSGSLGISYPTSVTGTTTSGPGYITVTAPPPDAIVGAPGVYWWYQDALNYEIFYDTKGTQYWASITWTNTAPSALSAPNDPDFADSEYEETFE